jgi:TonB family protein
MAHAALGQGTESRATVPSNVMPNLGPPLRGATADTIPVSQSVLQGLAVSEPGIVAPEGAPQDGLVSMQLLVSKTGVVEEVAPMRGDDALRKAAADGVMGWKYRPYLVNGEPREFQTSILIRFVAGVGTRMTGPPSGPAPNLAGVAGMTGVAGAGEVAGSSGSGQSGVGAQGRVPVSSGEMVGLLERQVAPVYPLNAKALHVQGLVVLHAVISKTGDVESVQVISGPPLLLKAAIDAVMRWKYRPYLRNGVPAEVVTTINVNFIL